MKVSGICKRIKENFAQKKKNNNNGNNKTKIKKIVIANKGNITNWGSDIFEGQVKWIVKLQFLLAANELLWT